MKRLLCLIGVMLACSACGMFDEEETKLAGDRITILSEKEKPAPSDSLDEVPVVLPDATAPQGWPQAGGNIRHYTGHVKLNSNLSRALTADAGGGEDWPSSLIAAPVATENMVFSMDSAGEVTARALDGLSPVRWRATLPVQGDHAAIGGGLAYEGGRLIVTHASGTVVALNADTGAQLWTRALKTPLRSAPAVLPGKVLVITVDSQLFCLDAETGDIEWRHRGIQETASLLGTVIPAADSGRAIVAYPSGEIYALSLKDGDVL